MIQELDREHREATAEYLRSEQALNVESIHPARDPEKIRQLIARRDAALERLNAIRDKVLEAVLSPL